MTVFGCGGGGGAGVGTTTRSVLERTIEQYGSGNVVGHPEDPEYLVRVGTLVPGNANEGLIFQVNGLFPPETNNNINPARTYMVQDTDIITWLLVTRR